jgi:hypothetical protein
LDAVQRIATTPMLRNELGEKGYQAFVQWWSREAHLKLYFDFVRKAATKKFGYVPWEREDLEKMQSTSGEMKYKSHSPGHPG